MPANMFFGGILLKNKKDYTISNILVCFINMRGQITT